MNNVPACLNDFLNVIKTGENVDETVASQSNAIKWLMCVGNHDLVAMSRRSFFDSFLSHLSTDPYASFAPSLSNGTAAAENSRPRLYFDYVCRHPSRAERSLRLIFLDGYEVSVCGALTDEMQEEANEILKLKNKNLCASPQGDWFAGLADEVCY